VRKLLVLDLDETLVHCSFQQPDWFDFSVAVPFEGACFDAYVQKRPFVDAFLTDTVRLFFVVIFTASLPQYANPIIDAICPAIPPNRRLFREHCTFRDGFFVKDLTIFNRSLAEIIIVDNNPTSFLMHPENGILSETWEGNQRDTELRDVILPTLRLCVDVSDVRPILAERRQSG
jgi:Dullard-like phosphatase family protein